MHFADENYDHLDKKQQKKAIKEIKDYTLTQIQQLQQIGLEPATLTLNTTTDKQVHKYGLLHACKHMHVATHFYVCM